MTKAVEEHEDPKDLGRLTDKRCPKCGAHLLHSENGDWWCSFVMCDWGLEKKTHFKLNDCDDCHFLVQPCDEHSYLYQNLPEEEGIKE